MAINFPSAPTNGQTHTENGSTWEYSVDEGGVWLTVPQTVTGPTGPAGPAGNAGNVQIGTVTTGAEGTSVIITNSGNGSYAVLNFTIPRGNVGNNGINGTNGANGFSPPITLTVEYPTNAEKIPMLYTPVALTVTRLQSILQGTATPTVTFKVAYGPILSDAGTNIITSDWVLNNTTYGVSNTTFDNSSIGVNNWIWFTTSAVTGTVNTISIALITQPT